MKFRRGSKTPHAGKADKQKKKHDIDKIYLNFSISNLKPGVVKARKSSTG